MNILFTDYCNYKCEYCFAEESMSCGSKENLSLENFEKIIQYHKENNIREFRIIGGEPTLHPDFIYYLVKLAHDKFFNRIHIFSNVSFDKEILDTILLLSKIKRITLLPNVNEPCKIGDKNYKRTVENLTALVKADSVGSLGINIYDPNMDIEYIFDLADMLKLKNIRWSVSVPNIKIDKNFDVKGYFKTFVPLLKKFFLGAIDRGIKLRLDCNTIPLCIFDDDEYRLLTYANPDIVASPLCNIIIDVKPNLDTIRCFGLSDMKNKQLENYPNMDDLKKSFEEEFFDLTHETLFDECSSCSIYKRNNLRSCSCLAYKLHRLEE